MTTYRSLVATALYFAACSPQVIDAVEVPATENGGSAGSGATGATGATGALGGTGATGATGGRGGSGAAGGYGGSGATGGYGGSGATGATGATGPQGGTGALGGGGAGGSAGSIGDGGEPALGGTGGTSGSACVGAESLVHRYTFDGTGTAAVDYVGGADGEVVGATMAGDGTVRIAGRATNQYVDLPNGMLSVLDSATIETWLVWDGGNPWQRIFDFGDDQSGVEGGQGACSTCLFLTPRIPDDGGAVLRLAYQRHPATDVYQETQLDATRTLPMGVLTHVAVTVDAVSETWAVYIDGALENAQVATAVPIRLSVINDINNWVGKSQYGADPELGATIEEFRIYARALDAAELQASFDAGPNPTCLENAAP